MPENLHRHESLALYSMLVMSTINNQKHEHISEKYKWKSYLLFKCVAHVSYFTAAETKLPVAGPGCLH